MILTLQINWVCNFGNINPQISMFCKNMKHSAFIVSTGLPPAENVISLIRGISPNDVLLSLQYKLQLYKPQNLNFTCNKNFKLFTAIQAEKLTAFSRVG